MSRALQKQEVKDYWLSGGFGGWLGKLLVPSVAPALFEDGVIIPKLSDGNKLDKGLFEAMRGKLAVDERQAWRALQQAGYLAVVETKQINDEASLVLKPPNERVAAAVRAGIFDPVLRNTLADDDLVKLVTDTALVVETHKTYWQGVTIGAVEEKHVQSWYAIAWGALKYEFVSEQPTAKGRADFVFEGPRTRTWSSSEWWWAARAAGRSKPRRRRRPRRCAATWWPRRTGNGFVGGWPSSAKTRESW